MLLKKDYYTLYHDSAEVYNVERILNSDNEDGWKYIVIEKSFGWAIRVFDENGGFLGYL